MKKAILYVLLIIFIGSSLYTNISMNASLNAIKLWLYTLLPSFLFPLIIIRLISPYHLLYPVLKPFDKIIEKIFNMDVQTFEYICTSLLLGFPSTSIVLEEKARTLPKEVYKRLIYIPFMASPAFILISLSTIYDSMYAQKLFLIQILSIFTLLIIHRKPYIHIPLKKENVAFYPRLSYAIKNSFEILFTILANILLVYVSIDILTLFLPEIAKIPFKLLSEFSSGCFFINTLHVSQKIKMLFTSILLSYGGLCVHLQLISSLSNHFDYKSFLKTRLTHILLAILYTILLI